VKKTVPITFTEAQKLAWQVSQEVNKEKKQDRPPFVVVADILEEAGEVASVVKGLEGYKPPEKPKTREMLGNELSDLLYSVFTLATMYGIQLEDTYVETVKGYRKRFLKP